MRTEAGYIVLTRPLIGTPDLGMRSNHEGGLHPRTFTRPQTRECSPALLRVELTVSGNRHTARRAA